MTMCIPFCRGQVATVSDYECLIQLFEHIDKNKQQVGLYRTPGNAGKVRELLKCLRKGGKSFPDDPNVLVYTSAAKEIIKDNKLIEMNVEELNAYKNNVEQERMNAENAGEENPDQETPKVLSKIAQKLTGEKRMMLILVFNHIVRIAETASDVNKMDLNNLATCFGPSVIHMNGTFEHKDVGLPAETMINLLKYFNKNRDNHCFDKKD